ncbi:hypothetical protein [Stackebrandtia soli]|uniref:hypothetical protein n=1 Tax=Stackebrandtia soli TaxID=1892856 RepID=UPI0039E92494
MTEYAIRITDIDTKACQIVTLPAGSTLEHARRNADSIADPWSWIVVVTRTVPATKWTEVTA